MAWLPGARVVGENDFAASHGDLAGETVGCRILCRIFLVVPIKHSACIVINFLVQDKVEPPGPGPYTKGISQREV